MNRRRNHGKLWTLAALTGLFGLVAAPALAAGPSAIPSASFQLASAEGPLAPVPGLLRQGRFQHARALVEPQLLKDGMTLQANLLMGQVLDHMGEAEAALVYFKRAADAHPDSLEAQVWWGSGLLAVGKYDQAIAASEKAIAAWEKRSPDPEHLSRLWVTLAGAQGLKAKREGVFAMIRFGLGVRGNLEKAVALDPNSRAQYALGRYYVEAPAAVGGDPKKGLPFIVKALKEEPYFYAIRAHEIRGLLAAGQKAEAQERWGRFKADFGDYPGVMADAKDLAAAMP